MEINLVLNGITTIAAVVAAYIAVKTLSQSQKDQKEGLDRQKKQATLDAYNVLQEQALDKINAYQPAEIRKIVENNRSEEYKKISEYLARIEHFCVGLTNGIYDYDTFYNLAHGYFDSEKGLLIPRLLPIVEKKSGSCDEDYYSNLHKVWKEMKTMSEDRTV